MIRTQMFVLFFVPFCESSVSLNKNYRRRLFFKFKFLKIWEALILHFSIKYIHLFIDGDFIAMKVVIGKIST